MSDIGKEIYERYQQGYDRGVADERARCIKVLEDLRARTPSVERRHGVMAAIDALRESNGSVGSSPVGGEQR